MDVNAQTPPHKASFPQGGRPFWLLRALSQPGLDHATSWKYAVLEFRQ
jgi:hypothetical protein